MNYDVVFRGGGTWKAWHNAQGLPAVEVRGGHTMVYAGSWRVAQALVIGPSTSWGGSPDPRMPRLVRSSGWLSMPGVDSSDGTVAKVLLEPYFGFCTSATPGSTLGVASPIF